MMPLLIYLLFFPPWPFLVLALLSLTTGLACARWMPGVSRRFGLLTAGAVWVVLGPQILFPRYTLDWAEAGFGFDLPREYTWLLTVAIYLAGIIVTWGICRWRRWLQTR